MVSMVREDEDIVWFCKSVILTHLYNNNNGDVVCFGADE